MPQIQLTYYSRKEEILNVITHGLGLLLSMAGLALLVTIASLYGTAWHIVSFTIFGSSMVILYLASTLYHATKSKALRRRLNVLDHAAIYILIAGTYTPFCLVPLNGAMGWVLFGITWGLALAGIVLKLFYTGRYHLISTVSYILMGWVAVIASRQLFETLDAGGLLFLLLGGVSYTIGAIVYMIERLPFNHAIFHVWVLAGSFFHFIAVFFFLI